MRKTILNIIMCFCFLLNSSLWSVFLGVENTTSKKVSVVFQFLVSSINGAQRCVDGELKVGGKKFDKWYQEEINEDEKKGDAFLVFFSINDRTYDVEEKKGRYWYLTIEKDPMIGHLKGELVKYHESYNEERDKEEERLKKSIVAQRVRAFTFGATGSTSSSSSPDQRGDNPYLNRDPKKLTRLYTQTLKKILE